MKPRNRGLWDGVSHSGPLDFGGEGGSGRELNFTGSTYAAGLGGHVGRGTFAYRAEGPRGPKGYRRSDERINEDLFVLLARTADVDVREVSLRVQQGEVTLDGEVPERAMKYRIEDVVAECPGVVRVDNRIRVATGAGG
jgi:hypothetical protein